MLSLSDCWLFWWPCTFANCHYPKPANTANRGERAGFNVYHCATLSVWYLPNDSPNTISLIGMFLLFGCDWSTKQFATQSTAFVALKTGSHPKCCGWTPSQLQKHGLGVLKWCHTPNKSNLLHTYLPTREASLIKGRIVPLAPFLWSILFLSVIMVYGVSFISASW